MYQRFLEVFAKGVALAGENCERVESPYQGGGVGQHSSLDNSANAGACIADWVAETLRGRTAL